MLLGLAVFLFAIVVLVNGFTDAPNSVATVVCTGTLNVKRALYVCAVFNFIGVLLAYFLGGKIAKFVFSLSQGSEQEKIACACLFCVIIFGIGCWIFGLPSSESHAIICSLCGASFFCYGSLNGLKKVGYVFAFMVFSDLIAFGLAYLFSRFSIIKKPRKALQIFLCSESSLMHGWQDGQKLCSILFALACHGINMPIQIPLLVGVIMALGSLLGGKKIIKTLGCDLVKLSSQCAICSELGSYLTLFAFSTFGASVSTSCIKALSILGAGAGNGKKINKKATAKVLISSAIAFPICFLIGYYVMLILDKVS